MGETKFRGKCIGTGEWVYGSLINNAFFKDVDRSPCCYILDTDKLEYDCWEDIAEYIDDYEVIPETVGQFTGLQDKNGKDIYEGDIVRPNSMHITCDCQVIFKEGAFMLKTIVHNQAHFLRKEVWNACEVIGNQYESPELINNK